MKQRSSPPQRNCQKCTAKCTSPSQGTAVNSSWNHNADWDLPVKISRSEHRKAGSIFEKHWHEQIQILYFEKGEAFIHCNTNTYMLKPEDIMIINSNELHYGVTYSEHLVYYIIKIDFGFLSSSQHDVCQTKYISPLLQGLIRFEHQISQDSQLLADIRKIINEYIEKNIGYELAIKAHVYHMLAYLLRYYQQKILQPEELERQQKTLHQLRNALEYMDEHYNKAIRLKELAALANMSSQHFCRLFKALTGKRPMDYINFLRINKAAALLAENRFNISEVAAAVGFDDSNYFSRIFKKYKNVSPSALRK